MNEETREILVILGEEASEVSKEIFKIMRFGPDQCKPNSEETNIQALEKEIGDLMAMIELIMEQNVGITHQGLQDAKKAKFEKLKQWSNISINK